MSNTLHASKISDTPSTSVSPLAETIYESPLGPIFLRASDDALLELHFLGDALASTTQSPATPAHPVFAETFRWLDKYFSGRQPDFAPPLQLDLTSFNRRVLEIASQVPFGETMTYGEIADLIAAERGLHKMSAQAVGSAMRKNPICLVIPCHRIIGAGGRLGGYNGNPLRKRQLLAHEGVDVSALV